MRLYILHAGEALPLSRGRRPAARLHAGHLEPLYGFLDALGASVLVAAHSRYVVDLNRPPDDANLYPGQDTTGLVPVDTFHREAIYLNGEAPQESEVRVRVDSCWRPYHDKLQAELERLRSRHGVALLWDAHSIASEAPRFFSGRLPRRRHFPDARLPGGGRTMGRERRQSRFARSW